MMLGIYLPQIAYHSSVPFGFRENQPLACFCSRREFTQPTHTTAKEGFHYFTSPIASLVTCFISDCFSDSINKAILNSHIVTPSFTIGH